MADIIGGNGQALPLSPPEDALTITIKYWWTPQGTMMAIDANPSAVYGDTMIDAFQRAARHYERQMQAGMVAGMMQQAAQLKSMVSGLGAGKVPRG